MNCMSMRMITVCRHSLHLLDPAQQPRQSAAIAGGDYRVLLLDDEKHSEQLVVRVLCKVVGCRVTAQHCLPMLCVVTSWRAGGTGSSQASRTAGQQPPAVCRYQTSMS